MPDDYISREAVCYQLEKQESIDGQPRAIRRARRIVAEFPASDVVEVRHGRWIWNDEEQRYLCEKCGCSAQGNLLEVITGFWRYCPHCGVETDESEDGKDV